MKAPFHTLLLFLPLLLTSCYVDSGKTSKSSTPGYQVHENKTLNVSVLTPDKWKSEVTTGGYLAMSSPDKKRAQILVMRRPIQDMMNGKGDEKSTLEDYKKYRISQMTEDVIGSELKHTTTKSTLAGQPAYQTQYSYKPKDKPTMHTREIYSVIGGKVYQIQLYYPAPFSEELEKTFKVVKDSYKLLKP
ncbi:MAG: DUF1795 domain-containing protein [Verrucomicrobiales bacterium]|nr:DUF1795 domain-containing protein [Verrucomicrobiales bacterium]